MLEEQRVLYIMGGSTANYKAVLLAIVLFIVAVSGANGNAMVTGTVLCDQCKDGHVSLFDYPLGGVKVAMVCPGETGMETIGEETSNMFGSYTMRFDGSPDLSKCFTQLTPNPNQQQQQQRRYSSTSSFSSGSNSCQASAGPSKSPVLTFSFFGMEMYSVDALISQPAQPMSFCSDSFGGGSGHGQGQLPPFPFPSPSHPVVDPSPNPPARSSYPSPSTPRHHPVFRFPPMPPLPQLPPMPPVLPFLEASACSHEYWMMPQYRCYWKVLNPDTQVALLFGPLAAQKYGSDMTLWNGLQGRGDLYRTLLREGVTALLNSYNSLQFPYSSIEVVSRMNMALLSHSSRSVLLTALRFKRANSGHRSSGSSSSCRFQSCK